MALSDEVQTRYSTQYLANLSNAQNPSATTVNTTTLGAAATDVQADIEIRCGVAYDGTDARHVSAAVEGVITKLMIRTGQFNNAELEERYNERLLALAKVTGRNRIMPTTDGILTPSSEQVGTEAVRPDFDRTRFKHYVPGEPGSINNLPED